MKRRKAREITLQILFMLDTAHGDQIYAASEADSALQTFRANLQLSTNDKLAADEPYLRKLLTTILLNGPEIDALIVAASENWRMDRMNQVDKAILRLAVTEMRHIDDVPHTVTMDEAIELGKRFGTEESPAFINGIVDKVWKTLPNNPKKALP